MASWLDTVFGGGAQQEAADKNAIALAQYGQQAGGALTSSYGTSRSDLGNAITAYSPLTDIAKQYNQAGSLYTDALGANGPEGNARATGAFQNAPGTDLAIKSGLDAIQRIRGYGGMGNSGNTNEDALTFAQNLQNQQYNTWLQNLQSAGQTGVGLVGQAAQGQAGGYTNLAGIAQQYGQNQAGVASNVASGTVADNNMVAAGQAAGAKNLLGAGLSIASMVAGGPLGGAIGGGLGSLLNSQPSTGATFGGYSGMGPGASSSGSGMMGGVRYPAF